MSMPVSLQHFFFFNDTATTEIYTLSLHDALPICRPGGPVGCRLVSAPASERTLILVKPDGVARGLVGEVLSRRSEEHTSELQSRQYLVCRLLLEKKNNKHTLLALYTVDAHI